MIMIAPWAAGKTHDSAAVDKVVFYQFCQQCTKTKKPICTLTDNDTKTRLLFQAPLCIMEVYEHHCQYYFLSCCKAFISVHLKHEFLSCFEELPPSWSVSAHTVKITCLKTFQLAGISHKIVLRNRKGQ
jgi:hypothetical protein